MAMSLTKTEACRFMQNREAEIRLPALYLYGVFKDTKQGFFKLNTGVGKMP